MRYELESIFQFLSTEIIKASDLRRGDVAFIHQRWCLAIKIKTNDPKSNNGWNQEIQLLGNGTSYLPSDHNVTIIRRDILDHSGLLNFIQDYEKEQKRLRQLAEQEAKEEAEREKEYLRDRLRELGDD